MSNDNRIIAAAPKDDDDDDDDMNFFLLGIRRGGRLFFFLLLDDRGGILIGNLTLDTDKVGDTSIGITQSSDKELVPEGGTVDTVIEQTNRHVVALFNGLADTFDRLGVGFGTLQETAVTSQDLVQRVARQVEETLRGVNNGIVGKRGIGDDKVLLGRLQGLDKGEIRVIEDLVGDALTRGQETIYVGARAGLVQELFGSGGTKLLLD